VSIVNEGSPPSPTPYLGVFLGSLVIEYRIKRVMRECDQHLRPYLLKCEGVIT
jgi:hypothetical protein